jgi:hypothetical protein
MFPHQDGMVQVVNQVATQTGEFAQGLPQFSRVIWRFRYDVDIASRQQRRNKLMSLMQS